MKNYIVKNNKVFTITEVKRLTYEEVIQRITGEECTQTHQVSCWRHVQKWEYSGTEVEDM